MKAQQQSGMERKHEEWVNEVLNFLQEHSVPTYMGGWNANSDAGMRLPKGPTLDIPDRLKLFREMLTTRRRDEREARVSLDNKKDQLRESKKLLFSAEEMLVSLWIMLEHGESRHESEGMMAKFKEMMEQRRPALFEEDDDDD